MTFEEWMKYNNYSLKGMDEHEAEFLMREAWDCQQAKIKALESENKRLRSAALEVVSWDWRELRRRPNHIDWITAPHAVDKLKKALEGE